MRPSTSGPFRSTGRTTSSTSRTSSRRRLLPCPSRPSRAASSARRKPRPRTSRRGSLLRPTPTSCASCLSGLTLLCLARSLTDASPFARPRPPQHVYVAVDRPAGDQHPPRRLPPDDAQGRVPERHAHRLGPEVSRPSRALCPGRSADRPSLPLSRALPGARSLTSVSPTRAWTTTSTSSARSSTSSSPSPSSSPAPALPLRRGRPC